MSNTQSKHQSELDTCLTEHDHHDLHLWFDYETYTLEQVRPLKNTPDLFFHVDENDLFYKVISFSYQYDETTPILVRTTWDDINQLYTQSTLSFLVNDILLNKLSPKTFKNVIPHDNLSRQVCELYNLI